MMEGSNKMTQPLFRNETPYGYLKNIDLCSDTPAHGLKKVPIQYLKTEEEKKVVMEEASLLRSLNHPNILTYTESYISQGTLFMCLKTDLIKELKQKKNTPYDEKTIIHIFHHICEGIKYLHDNNLIHKDLRPENIYFTQNNEIKIDFIGLEKTWSWLRRRTPTVLMYPIYDAPENLTALPYTKISNMWSLGVILYELCTLKHPFEGSTNAETDENIFSLRFNTDDTEISIQLEDLMVKLLKKKVEERYTIDQVLELPIFSDLRKNQIKTAPSDLENVEKDNLNLLSNSGCDTRDLGLFQHIFKDDLITLKKKLKDLKVMF